MKISNCLVKFCLLAFVISFVSCTSDDDMTDPDPMEYTIPTSYDFDNVSYSGQTSRLDMMTEWKSYMSTSRTSGVSLDANKMKAMFANEEGAGFSQEYSKDIKSKTFESFQDDFEDLIDELATTSGSTVTGSEGVSGVIESLDGESSYLIGEDGLDHAQVIEKGLMGACFYYQGTAVYFGDERMNVDNITVEEGEGTAMEHHWDEAFGYFGVSKSFPADLDILKFWGEYSVNRNELLGSNQLAMDAFLKGRAAISNNDLITRDDAIGEGRDIWEKIAVGSALHYLNAGMANFDDRAIMSHGVSEAVGFIFSLQFNPDRKITPAQINELLEIVAGDKEFKNMNLYNTSSERLLDARDKLANYYDLEDKKEEF